MGKMEYLAFCVDDRLGRLFVQLPEVVLVDAVRVVRLLVFAQPIRNQAANKLLKGCVWPLPCRWAVARAWAACKPQSFDQILTLVLVAAAQ